MAVIHIVLSVDAACRDIPLLLSSKALEAGAENLGSGNYAQRYVLMLLWFVHVWFIDDG